MKKYLLLALAGLALVGCNKDNKVKTNAQNNISFATQTSMTRATEVTTSTLESFKVYVLKPNAAGNAYEAYFNAEVTKDANTAEWVYNPVQQWLGDKVLNFYAYSPAALTYNETDRTIAFAPDQHAKDQQDFVVASLASAQAAKAVMPFKHALTQIIVKGKNTGDKYDVEIAGVRLTNFHKDGTLKYEAAATPAPAALFAWNNPLGEKTQKFFTSPEATTDVVALNAGTTNALALDFAQGAFMVIPQDLSGANKWDGKTATEDNNKKARLSFLLRVKKAGEDVLLFPSDASKFGWGACAIETNFEAGKRYTITLDFANGAGIQDPDDTTDPKTPVTPENPTPKPNTPVVSNNDIIFDVVIDDWADGGDVNIGL